MICFALSISLINQYEQRTTEIEGGQMLINKMAVRREALSMAKATRFKNFSRVGKSFYEELEWKLKASLSSMIGQHPSKGVTLQGRHKTI